MQNSWYLCNKSGISIASNLSAPNDLLVTTRQPVGVLNDTLFPNFDEKLVSAECAHVGLEVSGRHAFRLIILQKLTKFRHYCKPYKLLKLNEAN